MRGFILFAFAPPITGCTPAHRASRHSSVSASRTLPRFPTHEDIHFDLESTNHDSRSVDTTGSAAQKLDEYGQDNVECHLDYCFNNNFVHSIAKRRIGQKSTAPRNFGNKSYAGSGK